MIKPVIAGNWKMNKKVNEAIDLVTNLKPLVEGINQITIIVCPPFTSLYPFPK